MTFARLLDDLNRLAPFHLAQPWDRVGAMVGRGSSPVKKVLVSLDASLGALEQAIASNCDAWITHHPLIWDPLKSLADLQDSNPASRSRLKATLKCLESGICAASCHTNWDAAEGGVNDSLADALGMRVVKRFGEGVKEEKLKMAVTLPLDQSDAVILAASEAGAGEIGLYKSCSFSWEGHGTFLPTEGARPAVGEIGQLNRENEARIEMVLPARLRSSVESAVRLVHPYEEPAIDWFILEEEIVGRLGVIAQLPEPTALESLAGRVSDALETQVRSYGNPKKMIVQAALVGGAGSGFWRDALGQADVLITGEVKQSDALEAAESGLCVIEAGHYATEQPGMEAMARELRRMGWEAACFTPTLGMDGRPF